MTDLCSHLHHIANRCSQHQHPFDLNDIPSNGLFVLFEQGEEGHGGNRIVCVGTHTGKNRLGGRLEEHYIKNNKDRSVLRKHIGRAMLTKADDHFLQQWNWTLTSKVDKQNYGHILDLRKQKEVEEQVTTYLHMRSWFVVIPLEDDKSARFELKQRITSTISRCTECGPSESWLGLYAPSNKIVNSGLWQVKGLNKAVLNEQDFQLLEDACRT